jgi:DNA-directed RNA polymerase subunit omega
MEKAIRTPIYAVPDDPDQSTYRFIIISAKRARQLQSGARSFLPSTVKKPTVAAMEEVRRGLVSWYDASLQTSEPTGEETL